MALAIQPVTRPVGRLLVAAAFLIAASACPAADTVSQGGSSASNKASGQGKAFPSGTTMKKLADAGTIRVGIKFDQPLFGLMGLDGKPTGLDVEIAKIISHALGIPDDHIKWIETPYERGALSGTSHWTAILTVVMAPPSSADTLRKNPLGIYVDAIDWSR